MSVLWINSFASAVLSWVTSWSQALDSNTGDWSGTNLRQLLPASGIAVSGSNVRLTFAAPSSGSMTVASVYIGEQAASGDAYDFASAPTQVTFSGAAGFTRSSGSTIVSDPLAFLIDENKSYIVALYITSGTTRVIESGTNWYKITSNECSTANVAGYTVQTRTQVISMLEVA